MLKEISHSSHETVQRRHQKTFFLFISAFKMKVGQYWAKNWQRGWERADLGKSLDVILWLFAPGV